MKLWWNHLWQWISISSSTTCINKDIFSENYNIFTPRAMTRSLKLLTYTPRKLITNLINKPMRHVNYSWRKSHYTTPSKTRSQTRKRHNWLRSPKLKSIPHQAQLAPWATKMGSENWNRTLVGLGRFWHVADTPTRHRMSALFLFKNARKTKEWDFGRVLVHLFSSRGLGFFHVS